MFSIIRFILIGIVIGMANVIPGVSGGTLAVVFNVYDQFIEAITFNVKKIWANKKFVFPILGGMALGVLIFSKLISLLYTNFPFQTNCFFTGLIIGSIPLLFSLMVNGGQKNNLTAEESAPEKKSAGRIAVLVLCAVMGFALLVFFNYLEGIFDKSSVEKMVLPDWTVKLAIRIFIAGFIGAIAMIVPGISGSLLMLMMGVYTIVITAIPALFVPETAFHALILLLPNGVGVLIGLVSGAKAISWLLKKFPHQVYAVIFGLICGSVIVIFPGFAGFATVAGFVSSVICIAAGVAMAYFSSKLDPK